MDDLQKKIEALEKRITTLESQQKDNLNMFGRSYAQVGKSSSDFLIKTKGQVKIQWGNKFIDLIKDGKLNVDSSVVKLVSSKDSIGTKDGIYVTEEGTVHIQINSNIIDLATSDAVSYVSFLEEQETTSENKYTALKNIGFIYQNINDVSDTALKNGIIYIESEKKLYIVENGALSEYNMVFPSTINSQFVIAKNDNSVGSLLIKGSGKQNSLAFDSLYIFTDKGNSYINSGGKININIDGSNCIEVTLGKTTIKNIVESNTFQSIGGTEDSGFQLKQTLNGSTLFIDKVVERNSSNTTSIYPIYWSSSTNIITKTSTQENQLYLTLKYPITYKVGDTIYFYNERNYVTGTILSIEGSIVAVQTPEENLGLEFIGSPTFLISTEEEMLLIRYSNNIDLLKYQTQEQDIESIKARLGNLSDLQIQKTVSGTNQNIEGEGLYSNVGYFNEASYISSYLLEESDDSSKFASTEWTNKKLEKLSAELLPVGTIIAFHGETIPEGWSICDGTNNTPNLIGKFIVADVSEKEGDEITVTPLDTQANTESQTVKILPTYYSLIFIMKTE